MNIVMNEQGHYIEVQGTAENGSMSPKQLSELCELAQQGAQVLLQEQNRVLGL